MIKPSLHRCSPAVLNSLSKPIPSRTRHLEKVNCVGSTPHIVGEIRRPKIPRMRCNGLTYSCPFLPIHLSALAAFDGVWLRHGMPMTTQRARQRVLRSMRSPSSSSPLAVSHAANWRLDQGHQLRPSVVGADWFVRLNPEGSK